MDFELAMYISSYWATSTHFCIDFSFVFRKWILLLRTFCKIPYVKLKKTWGTGCSTACRYDSGCVWCWFRLCVAASFPYTSWWCDSFLEPGFVCAFCTSEARYGNAGRWCSHKVKSSGNTRLSQCIQCVCACGNARSYSVSPGQLCSSFLTFVSSPA